MENLLYNSSNPNSVNSSPRSRDIDLENSSWDERLISNNNYKVKFLCSYGGRIQLRPHDNQLTYVGGHTKILAVDRNIKFLGFISKLAVLCDHSSDACFKYQLPGEDLDALISVTNDEDLEHMMLEYDRIYRISAKPARLRLFIFQVNTNQESEINRSDDSKGVGQWYDVLNSVQSNESLEVLSPPSEAAEKKSGNPDYLFGLEKGQPQQPVAPTVMVKKEFEAAAPEERYVNGESPVKRRDVQELQRMQISSNNEDYYRQKDHLLQPRAAHMAPAAGHWQERNEFFTAGANIPPQPVYLVQTPSGVYQTPSMRPVTGQVSRAYYGVQGMVPGFYREQLVNYDSMVQKAPSPIIQPSKVSGSAYPSAGIVGVSQPTGFVEGGFTQLGHKAVGRDGYYHFP